MSKLLVSLMKIVPSEERAEHFLDRRPNCEHEDKQEDAIALPSHDLQVSLNLRSFVIPNENIVAATMHPDIVADLNARSVCIRGRSLRSLQRAQNVV